MTTKWGIKELLTSVKLNQMGVRRLTPTEQQAILDIDRLEGDLSLNTTDKYLEMYRAGAGSTYEITRFTNFLWANKSQVGIGATKQTVHDEPFINTTGKFSNHTYVLVEYQAFVSVAGEVEAVVTDGSGPISDKDTFTSDPTPPVVYRTFDLDSSGFALDDILNIQLKVQNATIQYTEFRGA